LEWSSDFFCPAGSSFWWFAWGCQFGFFWGFACAARLVVVPKALAFPCILIGLLGSPLCGAALTFFAAAKKVSKESGLPTASL
jgi:hypothetical protein